MSLLRKLAGETVIYGMSHVLIRVLHFVVFNIYLTYKFPDTRDYGIYTDLYAYATIILVVLVYRMDTAFFRFGSKPGMAKLSYATAYLPMIVTTVLLAIIGYLLSDRVADLLAYPGQGYYVQWFAAILAFDALVALPYARLRLESKPIRFLIYRLANVVITILIVIFFLEICPNMTGMGIGWIDEIAQSNNKIDYVFLANLVASILVFVIMLPEVLRINFKIDWQLWKKMFVYALPLVIVGIAGSINQAFAVPLQKYFLGDSFSENLSLAGEYAAPAKLALLLNLFVIGFNYAAEPFFFNNVENKDSNSIYGRVGLMFTIFCSFVLLGIVMYMDIIQYFIGPEYREALYIVPILLFAYLFLGLYYNFSIWYKLEDKTYYGAIISVMGAIITLGISITFLPKYGYIVSAWAALACYFAMALAGYWTGQINYTIRYPIGKILFYLVLSAVLVLVAQYIKSRELSSSLLFFNNTALLFFFLVIVWWKDSNLIKETIGKSQ